VKSAKARTLIIVALVPACLVAIGVGLREYADCTGGFKSPAECVNLHNGIANAAVSLAIVGGLPAIGWMFMLGLIAIIIEVRSRASKTNI